MDELDDPFDYTTIEIPTVVGLLRNILVQYPDNGQIIKELVQNAEDAGATLVEVLHDTRKVQCPRAHNAVQKFLKGPALCLYNNATFTTDDWEGIRKLSDSIKKDDPLKVGQFGLGFKSVFHITDAVTIISGDKVLFMDPSEPENKMCRIVSLKKLTNICPLEDCLLFWSNYMSTQNINDGHFAATLFWFPLRESPSKISDTVYSHSHVTRLFQSFGVEAPVCLTFLNSLEKICLKRINENHNNIEIIHEVELISPCMTEVQQKRRDFKQKLLKCNGIPSQTTTCYYEATIQSVKGNSTEEQIMHILHYLPGSSEASSVVWKGKDSSGHMPLVGVAAPSVKHGSSWSSGHIFCFLPLPLESSNSTNLPVHINGFFALDENRRHVKWKTEESNNEPEVLWNEELVSRAVVEAYYTLLRQVLQSSSYLETWYSLLPHINSLKGRWKNLATELWLKLKLLPILYSEVKGCMMRPQDVLLDSSLNDWPQHMSNSIRGYLGENSFSLASVPGSVLTSLHYIGSAPPTVTPQIVKEHMKTLKSFRTGWNRAHLLEYVVSDGNYDNLEGIPLLPLDNGTWITFSKTGHSVYICRKEEVGALLGLESQILRTDLSTSVVHHMQKIAQTGATQLKLFSPSQHGAVLISQSAQFVQQSFLSQHQLECWLLKVWSVVEHLHLHSVKNIALVPSSHVLDSAKLIDLSTAIIVQNTPSSLPQAAVQALEFLKVQVIPRPPGFVRHHQLHDYFNSSDARGVTQALLKVLTVHNSHDLARMFNNSRSDKQAEALLNVTEIHNLQPQIKELYKELHIFKATDRYNYVTDVCINNCDKIFPKIINFPVCYPETLIVPSTENQRQLAKNLGATEFSKEVMFLLALESTYSDSDTIKLVSYVLEDRFLLSSHMIQNQLKLVRFVPNQSGQLFIPRQLYDPEDVDNDALISEDLNPQTSFKKYYPLLRTLGMRRVQNMPINEFVEIIHNLHTKSLTKNDRVSKVAGWLRAANCRSDCHQICNDVRNVKFLYGETSKPVGYPNSLIWATFAEPYKPQEMKSYSHFKNTLGSVVPLIHYSLIHNVANIFGWNQEPSIQKYIDHLQNILKCYNNTEAGYFEIIKETYKQLSEYINTSDASNLLSLSATPCVFTEVGFKDPEQVYILPQEGDLSLLPYMYQLPFELRNYSSLFRALGCFETQSKELFLTLLRQIQQHHSSGKSADVNRDRRIVIHVLHKLVNFLQDIPPSELLLPVENRDGSLELIEVEKCTYSEQSCDWLDSEELGVRVVHSSVGSELAKALGVAPLNKHLLADEEAFMEWGQHEPLTTRLHNLLQQYRDGVAVIKELVQNADDACATTISFLYDERQNEDARTRLINNKLQEFQGPALWAYNDAMFTEDDFSNLRKLGGGTKEHQSLKIGKFGLGFCSVYNLTDVPSIVSGSNYIIFDPHLTYLDSNNQTPGVRYNFSKTRNSIMLQKLHGQFKPFNEVFGCNIQRNLKFDGTLFRFPLRTPTQASSSKISSVSYMHKDMIELLQMFSKIIGELLLFTQHIKEIKVFYLNKNASSPTEKVLLFESLRKITFSHSNSTIKQRTVKTNMESVANLFNNSFKWNGEYFEERTFLEINVMCSEEGRKLCHIDQGNWTVNWLTSWHCGNGASFKFAEVLAGRALPLSAVAVPLKKETDGWQPIKLSELPDGFYKESHMHCFLPLPVTTPLPVQVNGCFEVASDRTSLKTQTEDDRRKGIDWNETLMSDAVNAAYCSLLTSLQIQGLSQKCSYYFTWPIKCDSDDRLVLSLARHFYDTIVSEDLKVFRNRGEWYTSSVCTFLEESFYQYDVIGKIAFEFMENLMESKNLLQMVLLPKYILSGFKSAYIAEHMITQDSFLSDFFIPNISKQFVTSEKRNKLTLHIIDTKQPCLKKLKSIYCIPSTPTGNLRIPCDLIDPESTVAKMFTQADERFPEALFIKNPNHHRSLLDLGMNSSHIPIEMVNDRAKTVAELTCHNCAVERAFEILHYIRKQNDVEQDIIAARVKDVSFLPVMPKPQQWPLKWKADTLKKNCSQVCTRHSKLNVQSKIKSVAFAKPTDMCLAKFKDLVGSTNFLLWFHDKNNDWLPSSLIEKLGIIVNEHKLPIENVCQQLKMLATLSPVNSNISEMCHKIYQYFEYMIQPPNSVVPECLKGLRSEKVLLTNHGIVEPVFFALCTEIDCSPDLFSVQGEGLGMYQHLMKVLGIELTFHADVVLQVLVQKKEKYKLEKLNEREILQVSKLLTLMFNVKQTGDCQLPLHLLHLPDVDGYLCPIDKLCCEDGVDLSSGEFNCLHKSISLSLEMTSLLGIKTKTRKYLENSSNRIHFGQNEPLTTRLKNILRDYPCDSGIMKELLQNADDAGATEVAFIKDLRNLSNKKLFDKKWAPLQGPSLTVYNNKGFTEGDLRNIQDLGNSSKYQDPASTGQYGIGFNAVYHITDAPSFLTRGPDVPQGETLCMFDPHCWYDPMATPEKPGVQFINLNDLRKDYPDSFQGYLENIFLQQEGTVFRLPLRTVKESNISELFPVSKLEENLKEFQPEMGNCLLFLRNVRKISIMNICDSGECLTEYSVESFIQQQNEVSVLQNMIGNRNLINQKCNSVFNIDMVRASYIMKIADSKKAEYLWYIVQQLGAEKKDTVPEIVKDAFSHKQLNLLPHAGAAVLLKTNQEYSQDLFTTSCYLPLPVQSGLPFSVNGHFTLNSSRRDLWTGLKDCKATWNAWLMKEVLAPAAVYAVDYYRKLIFPGSKTKMTLNQYTYKMIFCQNTYPDGKKLNSSTWKSFMKWFYEYIINQQLHFFDVFIPYKDNHNYSSTELKQNVLDQQYGELQWHAYIKTGNKFPIYFTSVDTSENNIVNTLKRLGMKLGSQFMHDNFCSLGIECQSLTPDIALKFLQSWDKDYPDNCNPMIMKSIKETPFLCPKNVHDIFKYIATSQDSVELERLPLLLTNDNILRCFDSNKPVFISSYCSLLPKSGNEFLHLYMVTLLENTLKNCIALSVLKDFTVEDLADRLHTELGQEFASDEILPMPIKSRPNKNWLMILWGFLENYIKKNYCNCDDKTTNEINWMKGRKYIEMALGDWALYPCKYNNTEYLTAAKNAYRILDTRHHPPSVFNSLPIPHPCNGLPCPGLNLTATLENPLLVLDNLYFHRKRIAEYVCHSVKMDSVEKISQILEYFGQHCQRISLSQDKLRSLSIYEDASGVMQKLKDKKIIVPDSSELSCIELGKIVNNDNIVILKAATSEHMTNMYKYLNADYMDDMEIYATIILPKFTYLYEPQRAYFLTFLRDKLNETQYKSEDNWNPSQKKAVSTLKITPIIEFNGRLVTVDHFYDPFNPVFKVMKKCNLPPEWVKKEWHYFLKVAGMIHELTPEMFIQYASSLSSSDSEVNIKSQILTEHLFDNYEALRCKFSEIRSIEFLIPGICERLEQIFPHFRTASGLVSFSNSVVLKFSDISWTTTSLLPKYATSYNDIIRNNLKILEIPPKEKVFEHIHKLCRFLKFKGKNLKSDITCVMESIYQYLQDSLDNADDILAYQCTPIVHLPKHNTFSTADLVIENLQYEIIPYIYKAPVTYGKYFDLFKHLGTLEVATCDTYAEVLKMIYEKSQQQILHPEESKCMKLALQGLLENIQELKNLTVSELYLPTNEGRLEKSSEMYLVDIDENLTDIKGKFSESTFTGFKDLDISMNDAEFVNCLPKNLKPKLLSHVVKEELDSGSEEISSRLLQQVREFLNSDCFKNAVLRIINHDFMESNELPSKESEVKSSLDTVHVKQFKEIITILKVNENEIGKRTKQFFVSVSSIGERKVTLCICEAIDSIFLRIALLDTYTNLLNFNSKSMMLYLPSILELYENPHGINLLLNKLGIREWGITNLTHTFYRTEVGSYLDEQLIHLLDNEFCQFHEGEIVCMKKYINGEVEDTEENIYIIVQVKRLKRKHDNLFMNEYEVKTENEAEFCIIVRAHQLYKFVRATTKDCKDIALTDQVTDDAFDSVFKDEIMIIIRKQMGEIWKVEDKKERRHLLRRLILKWHPDKNSHRVELSTRVIQYIQHLLNRLENGEDISDDKDVKTSGYTLSGFYSNIFQPPTRQHVGSSDSVESQMSYEKTPDYPEAMRHLKQAEHDFAEACRCDGGSSCWIMYMCHQAAEKILKASLYLQNRRMAANFQSGSACHSLITISSSLESKESLSLAIALDNRVGHHTFLRYPSVKGCPCDHYTSDDAKYMLSKTGDLMKVLRPHFVK